MAPPRSEFWQYVTIVGQASGPTGVKVVKCVFCLNEYKTNNATRISTHLENCKFVEGNSNVSKKRITKDKGKSVAPLDSAETSTSGSGSTDVSSKYSKITDWASRMSDSERKQCDTELALAFFAFSPVPVHRKSTNCCEPRDYFGPVTSRRAEGS